MILKHLRFYAKNTLLVVLATIVLAGATGLSYKSHYCHGHLSGIAFFTELGLQKDASCGCKEDLAISQGKSASSSAIAFKKNACCSNISVFSKLDIESLANELSASIPLQPEEVSAVFRFWFPSATTCRSKTCAVSFATAYPTDQLQLLKASAFSELPFSCIAKPRSNAEAETGTQFFNQFVNS